MSWVTFYVHHVGVANRTKVYSVGWHTSTCIDDDDESRFLPFDCCAMSEQYFVQCNFKIGSSQIGRCSNGNAENCSECQFLKFTYYCIY